MEKKNMGNTVFEKPLSEVEMKASRSGNEAFRISARRKWAERLLLVFSGVIYAAAFPDMNWSFLGWVALMPLFWIIKEQTPGQAWRAGFLWGYAWSLTAFFWLREIETFIPYGMSLILALFPAFWAMAVPPLFRYLLIPSHIQLKGYHEVRKFKGSNPFMEILFVFALASSWSITEWIRTWIATGLPWNFLGVTQWQNISLIQISEYTGVYGVSFLLAAVNISLALAVRNWINSYSEGRYRRPYPLITSLLLVMLVVVIGYRSALKYRPLKENSIRLTAAILQGDIPQCRAGTEKQTVYALDKYSSLTRLALIMKPDIIIWPETAVPLPFRADHPLCAEYRNRIRGFIKESGIPFLIGSIDFGDVPKNADRIPDIYNSALFINKKGEIADKYYKIHIVPFGEFVPFADYFPKLVKWIGMGRNLSRGTLYSPLEIKPGVKGGMNICFEDIFPYISRNHTLAGANLLLVITNDAWYPKSSEPEQHLANSVFRAVENRRPMIRSGNNSCSCLIMPNGFISDTLFVEILPDGKKKLNTIKRGEGYTNFIIDIDKNPPLTFYTRFGDVFILLCFIILGFASGLALWNWRQKKQCLLKILSGSPPDK